MTSRSALFLALALAACAPSAPRAAAPTSVPAHAVEAHAGPDSPVSIAVSHSAVANEPVLTLTVRATTTMSLSSITLGVDLPAGVVAEGPTTQSISPVHAREPVEFHVRLRRTVPGPEGVTVNAWALHRAGTTALGAERSVTLFGAVAAGPANANERLVQTPDGTLLHETVIAPTAR